MILRRSWIALMTFALAMLNSFSWADDQAEKGKPTDGDKPKVAAEKTEVDRYEVPKTNDVDELAKFMKQIMEYRPTTPTDALKHREKAGAAVQKAADQILANTTDKTSAAYRLAYPLVLGRKAMTLPTKPVDEQKQMLAEVLAHIGDGPVARDEAILISRFARGFEASENEDLAAEALVKFSELLARGEDPAIKDFGLRLAGSVRRMKLIGNGMEVAGTRYTGEKFNLTSLKGKTILVDFWATWCGPCLREIPNMRAMYEAYHDKGFEIVGVSVDENRDALDRFLEKEKLPWIILHDEGGENPALAHYGVMGYPTMILIGGDGKVVSTHARGQELVRLLEKQLGPVEEKKTEEKKSE